MTRIGEQESYGRGFPGGSDRKESACNARDADSFPGLGSSSGDGNGKPLERFCLENPMGRGAWRATVHGAVMTEHAHKNRVM